MTEQVIEELKTMDEWAKFTNGLEHIEKVGMTEDMGGKKDEAEKVPSGKSEKQGGANQGIYNLDWSLEFFLAPNYSSAKYSLIPSFPYLQRKR